MSAGVSWDALRVFVAAHRAGSFSAAADELGVAQSSVSEQVARLERHLGYRLLDRSSSGVRATERGAELAARVSGPVDNLSAAVSQKEGALDGNRTVFLGGPAEFLSEVLLTRLAGSLPRTLRVMTRFGLASDLLDELRAGAIDVLVSAIPAQGRDLAVEPLCDEEFMLVAHPKWAAQADADLDAIPALAYGPELPIIRRYWRSVFGRRPDRLTPRVIAPDLRALCRLTVAGAGMTVLPSYLVREHITSGALIMLHEPEIAPLNTLFVVASRRRCGSDSAVIQLREAVLAAGRQAL